MSVSDNKKQKHGLGRGFESLIPIDLLDETFDPTADQDQQVSELRNIKIDEIEIDIDQPRKNFDEEEIEKLSISIKEHGVLQPIIVTPKKGKYQIVAGERRYRASKQAGLTKIPALVRALSDQHKLEISLIENLQRQDLNVMETATAYLKLRDQFNLTLEQIGNRVGLKSISSVSNKIRLLKLSDEVKKLLADKLLTEGQARPLIGLDKEIVKRIIPKIIREEWSARKIEQFVVDLKKNSSDKKISSESQLRDKPYGSQLETLKKHFKTDVAIRTNTKGAGCISIKFKDEKEFERIQRLLS